MTRDEEGEEHEQIRLVSTPEPPVTIVNMNEFSSPNGIHGSANRIVHHDSLITINGVSKEKKTPTSPGDIYSKCILESSKSQSCKKSLSSHKYLKTFLFFII